MNLFKRCRCPESSKCRHPLWYRFRLNGREHRGSTRTANHHLAGRLANRKYNDVLEGRPVIGRNTVKLSALARSYKAQIRKEHRTANKTERVLSQFVDFIGDRRAVEVSTFAIEKWKLARAQDVDKSTVNRELNVLKGFFRRAVAWKYLAASPATSIKKYRTDDSRIRVLTDGEIQTVMTKTPLDIARLCRATLECLPRVSELLTLRREPHWRKLD
jgi:hypothetical protein